MKKGLFFEALPYKSYQQQLKAGKGERKAVMEYKVMVYRKDEPKKVKW